MELGYSPLVEAVNDKGWEKQTIAYVMNNEKRVRNIISGIIRHNRSMSYADVDDIYSTLISYLYNCADYSIDVACEKSGDSGSVISLEGYVRSCIKFCTKRFEVENFKVKSHIVEDSVTGSDDTEHSVFDTISDSRSEIKIDKTVYNLYNICKTYEYQRYTLGVDIFMVWFIRLKTMLCNKDYKKIITTLGVTKQDITAFEKDSRRDGVMMSIAKAVTMTASAEEALDIIRQFVYSVDKIERAIENF